MPEHSKTFLHNAQTCQKHPFTDRIQPVKKRNFRDGLSMEGVRPIEADCKLKPGIKGFRVQNYSFLIAHAVLLGR